MRYIKFRFAIEHLWGLVVLMGIFVFVNTHPIRPYDFWWHITIGREIITTGSIPTSDIYSYTEFGQPYQSYQMFWLMEMTLYVIYWVGGPALDIFFQSMIITSAYGVIFWLCKQVSKSWRLAAVGTLFAAALGLNDWNVRPQGITFLLASFILLASFQYKKGQQWGWLIVFPICMLVWANSHGTFIIGLFIIAIWWGQQLLLAIKQRLNQEPVLTNKAILIPGITLGVSALVCLINPRGLGIINYLKTLTSNSIVQNLVTEWAPPTLNTLMGAIFILSLMGIATLLSLSPNRPKVYQIVTFLVFGLLGLKTSRGSVWFGVVIAPILVEQLSAFVNQFHKTNESPINKGGSRIINIAIAILIIVMGVLSLPWLKNLLPLPSAKAGLLSTETPVEVTRVLLEKNLPGRVFHSMSFGSYLIWAAYPRYQVFVDSRIELFTEKVWLDYLAISNAESDWQTLLTGYGINTMMLSPSEQAPLIKSIDSSDNWSLVYKDDVAYLFTRIK